MKVSSLQKKLALCLSLAMAVPVGGPVWAAASSGGPMQPAADMATHWAAQSADKWRQLGVMNGYEDGAFRPDQPITRAEFVALVNRIFGFQEAASEPFADVAADSWYAEDMGKAKQAGYFQGYPGNLAKADARITREEAMTLLARVFQFASTGGNGNAVFADDGSIQDFAYEAVHTLIDQGYMQGYEDHSIRPAAPITRAEVVTLLDRMVARLYNQAGEQTEGRVDGNVVMNHAGVTLKNAEVSGSLYITAGVGEGDAKLDHVHVDGPVYVSGGGEHSVTFADTNVQQVIINKMGKLRLVAEGLTSMHNVVLNSPVRLELSGQTEIDDLEVNRPGEIVVPSGAVVNRLTIGSGAQGVAIDAKGTIKQVTVGAENVKINGQAVGNNQTVQIDENGNLTVGAPGEAGPGPQAGAAGNEAGGGAGKDNAGTVIARAIFDRDDSGFTVAGAYPADTVSGAAYYDSEIGNGALRVDASFTDSSQAWQEVMIKGPAIEQAIQLGDQYKARFTLYVPQSQVQQQNADLNSILVRPSVMFAPDLNPRFGAGTTDRKLSSLPTVTLNNKTYYRYQVEVDIKQTTKAAGKELALGLAFGSWVYTGPLYVDDVMLLRVKSASDFTAAPSVLSHFITASGDKLYDGDQEFRFIGFNVPGLHMIEDPVWHFPDAWEQEDAIRSMAQMGGNATRIYTLSVTGGKNNSGGVKRSHVIALGVFDEEMFRALDRVMALANQYGIRVIIPFVDQWDWQGGIAEYAKFRGKTADKFWTDPQIRDDFKATISYLLNRTNVYTGVKYKDDKAVLCWETGNEIYQATDAWTTDIAAYIKSLDQQHLVMDGKGGVLVESLNNPNIDIITSHYYNYSDPSPFVGRLQADRAGTKGKKPFVLGEFGLTDLPDMINTVEEAVSDGSSGALIWSLRFHNKDGGFYFHSDGNQPVTSRSYHWPGFAENDDYYERDVIRMIRENAYAIRGLSVPAVSVPDAPVALPIKSSSRINWRGATGAQSYDIERAESPNGPWTLIAAGVSDSKALNSSSALYADATAENGVVYYYRIKANNESGVSAPSNVVAVVNTGVTAGNGDSENLAWTKSAVSSSDDGYAGDASAAVDGDPSTRWASTYHDDEWLKVDLGATYKVNRVHILWESAFGKAYQIEVSQDDHNWIPVYAQLSGTGGEEEDVFAGVRARYVRMHGIKRATKYGYSIYEFEVYGQKDQAGDQQSPSAPASLSSPSQTDLSVNLSWTAASDNTGVTGYLVYQNGVLADRVTGTTSTVVGLSPGTEYSFTVRATDAAGNMSVESAPLTVSTTGEPVEAMRNPEVVDRFDTYASDVKLNEAYGSKGAASTAVLVPRDNGKALQLATAFSDNTYTGLEKDLGDLDWTAFEGLSFYLKSDGSGQKLVIQLKANGIAFEAYPSLNTVSEGTVRLKFSDFTPAPWESADRQSALLQSNLNHITTMGIYINQVDGNHSPVQVVLDDIAATEVLYSFDASTEGWSGQLNYGAGLSVTTAVYGNSQGLAANIDLVDPGSDPGALTKYAIQVYPGTPLNLTGKKQLTLTVRAAADPGSSLGNEFAAKLFVKDGGYGWHDGGSHVLTDGAATTLTIDLSDIGDLSEIKGLGVEFGGSTGCSGTAQLFIDHVVVE
ncbi:S-layer homology domain-containing protein [Paenibacillus athensensis]|uniref:mannan endo-1,4-beta-mannosidase n=1 Tax=Paenibacillus athensensis TaxID=1967502 RepID=A0A4Y8Q9U0_9BACL|nr:S-layer homology domain-containing protein [Paenibacillus athensensis]MCD1260010.1 S-layer homology domain-containing protein [Paenibacillus athensensis]